MTSIRRRAFLRPGRIGAVALILLGAAGAAQGKMRNPLKLPDTRLEPTTWAAMEGWAEDDHDAAFATFLKSCRAILQGSKAARAARPLYGALYEACSKAAAAKPQRPGEARAFFEQNFRPVRISPLDDPDGFLTGYYEPIVEGVRKPVDGFDYPLYRKPSNLLPGGRMAVTVKAKEEKGKKKSRKHRRKVVAFHDRAAIDDGVLAGRDLEICWLRDPIDAFFAHIQGSVRVRLEDGETLRLNYQAANGHPYVAVGKYLIQRDIIPKDEMSMDRIREWMERNPQEGKELRRKNKSYVFFRETNLPNAEEPTGAQGVSLTPGRSIAVDRKLHVYGTPFFITAMLPIESLKPETPFRRLMVAQDTGGAIIGPARADIYFGAGDEAGSVSGRLRHPGRFVMLVPKALDPGPPEEVPLPRPKPPVAVAVKSEEAETPIPPAKADAIKHNEKSGEKKPEAKPPQPPPPPETKKSAARKPDDPRPAAAKSDAKKPGEKNSETRKPVDQKSKARKSEGKKPEPKKDAGKMAVFDRHDVKSMEDKPTPAKPAKKVGQKRKRKR